MKEKNTLLSQILKIGGNKTAKIWPISLFLKQVLKQQYKWLKLSISS